MPISNDLGDDFEIYYSHSLRLSLVRPRPFEGRVSNTGGTATASAILQ